MVREKDYFPVDIFAVKEYGIKRWQEEFFWPVSDHDFGRLCTDIEKCLIKHIKTQPEEISDLLLIQFSLRWEYWHFMHALKGINEIRRKGKEVLCSDKTLWYKEILAGSPIAVKEFGRGQVKYRLTNRIKALIAKFVWRIWYSGKSLRPKGEKDIVEIFGGVTPLMKIYMKRSSYLYNFTEEKDWLEESSISSIPDSLRSQIKDVSKLIADELALAGHNNGIEVLDNHVTYLRDLTEKMLDYAAQLMQSIKEKIGGKREIRLLTSSFVSLFSRALCISVRKGGGHVTTFNHGYDIGIHDTPSQSFLEFPISDEFVTYNQRSAELMEAIKNNHPPLRDNRVKITSSDSSRLFVGWKKYGNKPRPKKIKRIMFIGYPHNQFRKYFAPAAFSLIQLDMELRIVDFLKGLGYEIIYKVHPGRLAEARGVFEDKAEVLGGYFENYVDKADAFLFGSMRTVAFPIALCTKKPVISIIMDCEHSKDNPEAMKMLKKRCSFVRAKFDERNRIVFDEDELREALTQEPKEPDNEFLETYMFPSSGKIRGRKKVFSGAAGIKMGNIKVLIKNMGWAVARGMARRGIVWPFVLIYSYVIKEVEPKKKKTSSVKPTLLGLNALRFRGDLDILSKSGMFRVLKIPGKWQSRINSLFLTKRIEFNKNYAPGNDVSFKRMQDKLRFFLTKFLLSLYRKLKVDCILGAATHNVIDYYWGLASEQIGVPYIALHRENLPLSSRKVEHYYNRAKNIGRFKGSYVVVYNEAMKDIFIRSGHTSPEKIDALGCLRMDNFIKKVKTLDRPVNTKTRKKVVLFSFVHCVGLGGSVVAWPKDGKRGFVRLFDNVHTAIARIAMKNPDVDFVIKPKWGGDWPDRITSVCRKYGIEIKDISNLSIVVDCNVHELILSSDVVCGFNSTTLLEAAIAAKPVIIPYFDEASEPEYTDGVYYKDEFHLFDVAYSVNEFEELILKRLSNSYIDKECMSGRFRVFEKYVSSMKGDALSKYTKVIEQIIYDRSPNLKRKEKIEQ